MHERYRNISISSVINLEDWDVADEPLTGSRAKNTVYDPEYDPETVTSFVFKEPRQGREAQIWSELLASYIAGDLLAWPVQHVSLAARGGKVGNLMAYIYDSKVETFTEGWQLCRSVDPDYDIEKGHRHTLALLMNVGTRLEQRGLPKGAFHNFWGEAFALDALISNTDRHAENWAVIENQNGDLRMAPLYDNATSMGCEWDESGLERKWFSGEREIDLDRLRIQMRNGRHHVRMKDPGPKGAPFSELCREFLTIRPEQRKTFQQISDLDLQPVFKLLGEIRDIETLNDPYRMSEQRALQIEAILKSGQERIKNILMERM